MRVMFAPAVLLSLGASAALGQNLVANPGFDEGGAGWSLPEVYSVDEAQAHSGRCSLRYRNKPGGPYLLAGQALTLQPGHCYRMSVWVKTESLESTDTGATISMEWWGPEGYLGGAYCPGIAGTTDWQQLVFETGPVPDEALGGSVIVYGRPGTHGTAWFDDVEVVEVAGPLVRVRLADAGPGVRQATLLEGGVETARFVAEPAPERGASFREYALVAIVQRPGEKPEEIVGAQEGSRAEVVIPMARLPFGEATVEVRLVDRGTGRPVAGELFTLTKRRLLRLDLVEPNSAGALGFEPERDHGVTVRLTARRGDDAGDLAYRARLFFPPDGAPVERRVSTRKPTLVRLPTVELDHGLHDLVCELYREGEEAPCTRSTLTVTVADPAQRPANATYFRPNRLLCVEGKPFIPVGFYILSSFESVFPADQPYRWQTDRLRASYYLPILDRLADSHFNCVLDYGGTMGGMEDAGAFLDAVHARGLHAVFSVKDLMPGAFWQVYTQNLPWKDLGKTTRNVVSELREHPALIAWYVNDEVTQAEHWPGAVDVFRQARTADPWHPTYAVHYAYQGLEQYREACDVIGTDPYVLLGDIGWAARSWRASRELIGPNQPFWAVVQCFGPGYEFSRPAETREPTYDEERAATLAALAEGATGIIYYCYHSLERSPRFEERFAELDRIAAEVQELAPLIALPDAARPVRVESGTLSVLTKRGPDGLHVLLVSTLREEQEAVLRLPAGRRAVSDARTGERLPVEDGTVRMPFRALDARVLDVR
jgi:hypothetical protein